MRRNSLMGIIMMGAREAARQQRLAAAGARRSERLELQEQKRFEREKLQSARQMLLSQKQYEKELRTQHLESRVLEAEKMNDQILDFISELEGILEATLLKDDAIAFSSLRINDRPRKFDPPGSLTSAKPKPCEENYLAQVMPPQGLASIWPGAKKTHLANLEEARRRFNADLHIWNECEIARLQALTNAEIEYEEYATEFEATIAQRNAEIDEFEQSYIEGDPDAIVSYHSMVLERSDYPDGFPHNFSLAFTVASKQLVVEYDTMTGKP